MRIVHTSLRYPPASGGAEEYVRQIVEETRRSIKNSTENHPRYDVRVLTSKLRTHGPISVLDPTLLLNDPPYVQRLHHSTTPFISYPRLQALNYYLGHHQPDLIHGYGFWYQPADIAARYARRHQIPFIFHPIFYENDIRRKTIWQLYKKTIGAATFAAASVIAVISPYEQRLIESAGFTHHRFELLPPGIDTERFTTRQPNPFTAKGLTGPILLSVNRIAAGKGLDDVIEILPHLIKDRPLLHYVIIGEDFGYQKTLEQTAQKRGVQNHVHFFGRVDEPTLLGALQHATVYVHPSHYEAFGIAIAESLAAQIPVVARNIAAIPFVAPHRKAGLLFASQAELTSNIQELLQNETLRQQLIQSGFQHVQQFSIAATTKKIGRLYDELLPTTTR